MRIFLARFPLALCCLILPTHTRGETDAPPLSPEEQLTRFKLPPGFEIQLVASEPRIQKPMNLGFDPSGRLWVTGAGMYPFAARTDALGNAIPEFDDQWNKMAGNTGGGGKPEPSAEAIDTLRILSDLSPDGSARTITTFADGLNVPIGVQPLPREPDAKGDTAIVFSIPTIWKMTDTDGDGKADVREALYDRLGFTDTHGMSSNYLQWPDGWIYGCHGFSNTTRITDSSGKVTAMHSGNIYRFRADGSAFQVFGNGQANPFGLTFDERGNLYSCDSHSKPAYLVVKGGFAEGIGKNHDGLGFLPAIMSHSHGSSAIAGISYYGADGFPEEYRDNLFIGNPVTRRINRDRLEWTGNTPKAIEMEDFLSCDDPWFRPIQVKLGPDGALYIADFYNPIIGHYEAPLADPRRDSSRGRIWRVVWKGDGATPPALPDLTRLDDTALVAKFDDANLEVRRLARNLALARGIDAGIPAPSHRLDQRDSPTPGLFATFREAEPGDELTRYSVRVALRDRLAATGGFETPEVADARGQDAALIASASLAVPGAESSRYLLSYLSENGGTHPQTGEILRHITAHLPPSLFTDLVPLAEKLAAGPPHLGLEFTRALVFAEQDRGITLPAGLRPWTEKYAIASLSSGDAAVVDFAISLLATSENPEKTAPLEGIATNTAAPLPRRVAALAALSNTPSGSAATILSSEAPPELHRQAVANLSRNAHTDPLLAALPGASPELSVHIAAALAAQDASAARLLALIEEGKASPILLRNRQTAGEIANRSAELRARAGILVKDLPPENERLDSLIAQRAAAFPKSLRDPEKGAQVFATHCAACHKFKGKGGNLAPNLDGVGAARGPQRLIEDILDPDRNIDAAFRLVTLRKKDGTSVSGVNLREEDGRHVLSSITGQDVRIPTADAHPPEVSDTSLMPSTFEQVIPAADLNHLVHFLLQP